MNRLWEEIKRRNLVRVGLAYLVVGWLILQVGAIAAPALQLPDWTLAFLIFILMAGLPLALLLAWAFEMTPEGIKRTDEVDPALSTTPQTGQKLERITIGVLAVLVAFFLWDKISGNDRSVETEVVESGQPSGELATAAPPSIAVLPFADMSPEKDQEYFTDGISEELLNVLARTEGLRVAARTSSFAFKHRNEDIRQIGELLDVNHVLEGSIRKQGMKIRITAQLISVEDGYHIWSETYDRELTDVFAVQDEISAAIHGALKLHLLGDQGAQHVIAAANPKAYEHYLIAREYLAQRDHFETAVLELQAALAADPDYGPAHVALAITYTLLADRRMTSFMTYGDMPLGEVIAKATPHFDRARELIPDDPELHAAYGFFVHVTGGSSVDAQVALGKALELNPNLSIAYTWRSIVRGANGDLEGAVEDDQRAYELDPVSILAGANLARVHQRYGRIDKANHILTRLEAIHPGDLFVKSARSQVMFSQGNYPGAIANLLKDSDGVEHENDFTRKFAAFSYAEIGLYDHAKYYSPDDQARFTWMSGDPRKALEEAKKIDPLNQSGSALEFYSWFAALAAVAGDMETAQDAIAQSLELGGANTCYRYLTFALQMTGETEAAASGARKCLEQAEVDVSRGVVAHGRLARARILVGNLDGAIKSLEEVYELGGIEAMNINDPGYARLQGHSGFADLKVRMDERISAIQDDVLAMEADGRIPNPFAD